MLPVMVSGREMDVGATIPERGADRLHNRLLAFDLTRASLLRGAMRLVRKPYAVRKRAHVVCGVAATRRGVGRAAGGPPSSRRRRSPEVDRPSCARLPGPQSDLLQLLSRLRTMRMSTANRWRSVAAAVKSPHRQPFCPCQTIPIRSDLKVRRCVLRRAG
jgi:hypothetical protein